MKVTIKEIAKIAGVHRSTVDKVLHNREGVSSEVREKVQQIIEELGYEPNIIGKALKRQQNKFLIAVVLLQADYIKQIKSGIEKAYEEYKSFNIEVKYYIVKCLNIEEQVNIINTLIQDKVSGMIVSPINDHRVWKAIDTMVESGIPVVTTNSDIEGSKRMCFVGEDMERSGRIAGRLMGEFLNGSGKVAVITSSNSMLSVSKREAGFKNFIKQEYKNIEIIDTIETLEQPINTFEKTFDLLKREKELGGIYITCGCVSEVGKAIKRLNKGKDIKVICFERYPEIIDLIQEEIVNCTIDSDLVQQGYQPVKLLFNYLMYDKRPEGEYLNPKIDILIKEKI